MIVGAVLAAGAGTRMGAPKGELVVGGLRLVDRAVRALRAGGCDRVLAVVRDGVDAPDAIAIVNPDPDRGMRSSLELAVEAAEDADALIVVLADMPGVGAEAIAGVAAGWKPGRISAARYEDGRGGHPIAMSPALWRDAVSLAGPDEGARRLLAAHPDLVDAVRAFGDPIDLDRPDDLANWRG